MYLLLTPPRIVQDNAARINGLGAGDLGTCKGKLA